MDSDLSRRQAIAGIAAFGAAGTALAAQPTIKLSKSIAKTDSLGWDAKNGTYILPDLPYAYDALSSVIDEQTMRIHHTKHHAGYVKGLNQALTDLATLRWDPAAPHSIQHLQRQLSFHMGGHINHTLFWSSMKPELQGGGGQPKGNLLQALDRDFGSFGKFTNHFKSAAAKVEGSGWAWLVYEPLSSRLLITQVQNQQDMMLAGAIPLLGVDVWEHAYYLKYQNRRADYIEGFMRIIDWDQISKRFEAAR